MGIDFHDGVLLLGALLFVVSALSMWLKGSVLSVAVAAVSAGVLLAQFGPVDVPPEAVWVAAVVELALVVTLFADALLVEKEVLQRHWAAPTRALFIALPITLGLIAVAGHLLFDLTWAEACLLGAVLSSTDPVVAQNIVTAREVPNRLRHTLNLESGLNDGLALPFVLIFLSIAGPGQDAVAETFSQLGHVLVGAAWGIAIGGAGSWLLGRLPGGRIDPAYEGTFALSIALVAFSAADLGFGHGLIAVFVAGLVFAYGREDLPTVFGEFAHGISSLLQVTTFFLLGALLVTTGVGGDVGRLVLFALVCLLVARPIAVAVAMLGVRLPLSEMLFVAWFGPKGVASILFALIVLNSDVPNAKTIFDAAAFTVVFSIVAHGTTETVGARFVAWRRERRAVVARFEGARARRRSSRGGAIGATPHGNGVGTASTVDERKVSMSDVQTRIEALVAEERAIYEDAQAIGGVDPERRERLREIGVELDRSWDLLRQQRALADAHRDPGDASPRDEETVEGYLE